MICYGVDKGYEEVGFSGFKVDGGGEVVSVVGEKEGFGGGVGFFIFFCWELVKSYFSLGFRRFKENVFFAFFFYLKCRLWSSLRVC